METIKELEADEKYIATLDETMDSRDMSNQCLGYKQALKDVLGLIDEVLGRHKCMYMKELKARITGK